MSKRSFVVRIVAVGLSLIAGLLACEVVARVTASGQNAHQSTTLGIFIDDAALGHALAPDLDVRRRWGGRTIAIRTDHDGYRISTLPAAATIGGAIAFAGDSFVFGNEVDAEETFVHLVGQALGARSVNLGVSAYGLRQETLALRRWLDRGDEVGLAFLVIYLGNDLESGPSEQRTTRVDSRGQLISGRPPAFYTFALRHSRALFNVHRAWKIHSRSRSREGRMNWRYDAAAIESDPTIRERLADHRAALLELRDAAGARNVPLIVALLPERKQVYGDLGDLPNRVLLSMLDDLGMTSVDLLPDLRAAARSRPDLWNDVPEGHLSPEGHRAVTDALLRRIDADRLLESRVHAAKPVERSDSPRQ